MTRPATEIEYFFRPELGCEEVWGPTLGPFEGYVQLTYGDITVGPNGACIGFRSHEDGLYYFFDVFLYDHENRPIPVDLTECQNCPDYTAIGFTDVVIWAQRKSGTGVVP